MKNGRKRKTRVESLRHAIETQNREVAKKAMERLAGAEMGPLLISLDEEGKTLLLELIFSSGRAADILSELPDQFLKDFLRELSLKRVLQLLEAVSVDDAFHIYQEIPEERIAEVDTNLSRIRLHQFGRLELYPERTVGRKMDPNFFAISPSATTDEVIAKIRSQVGEEQVFYIYVVDDEKKLI